MVDMASHLSSRYKRRKYEDNEWRTEDSWSMRVCLSNLVNSEKWPTAGGTYLESSSNFVMGLL